MTLEKQALVPKAKGFQNMGHDHTHEYYMMIRDIAYTDTY